MTSARVQTGEPTLARFANPWLRYFAATRPAFLSATLVACLLGVASALHAGVALEPLLAGMTLLLALLLHAAVNVLNDYYDALNGSDDANTERLFPFTGGSRFIQNGVLTRRQTARYGYALLASAMLGGLWLTWQTGTGLLALGAAGMFIGWTYSATPLKLNSRGLGEVCVLAGFLGIVVGADFVQRQAFSLQPLLIGLPYALLVTNLLYINQFPDRRADAAAGKHHWVVRLPLARAALVYPALAAVALLWLAALAATEILAWPALLAALPLALSFRAGAILRRHADAPSRLLPAIRLTIAALLAHGILLAVFLFWNHP
jgi:1,4-dihydroxy-2-naphthoate octaprenyltransferase